MYEIEKNIPIKKLHCGNKTIFPFAQMEVGDSFVANKSAQRAANTWGKESGKRFTTRTLDDGSIRIWRVA